MNKLFGRDVLGYELRVVGLRSLAVPLVIVGLFAGLTGLFSLLIRSADHAIIEDMLTAGLEAGLSLGAGLIAATVTAQEPALEVQLALPVPYRFTAMRRLLVIIMWTACVGGLLALLLHTLAPWMLKASSLGSSQLFWLAPLLWFVGVGALGALLLRSRAASGALLGGIWIAQLLFANFFSTHSWTRPWFLFATLYGSSRADFWLANRVELLGTALAFLIAIWLFLRNSEWRLRAEES